jgi:hypothetical protein
MSTAPVVQDIGDFDLDGASFKSGKKKKVLFGVLAAAAVIGGAGFAITRLDQLPTASIEQPAAQAAALPASTYKPATPVATTPPTPEPAPAPAPAAAATDTAASDEKKSDSASSNRLSEEMKQALLEKDKTRKSKKGSKASAKSSKSSRGGAARRASGPSTGFKAGGDSADPLNGKL